MKGFGWRYEFVERSWLDVRDFLAAVDWQDADRYPVDIVDDVLDRGGEELLAVTTSMHDLVVAPRPTNEPPNDVIVVCAPGSVRSHPVGTVRIDCLTVIGKNTEIIRPSGEAVPLFWRFAEVEFGIRPVR